MIVRTLIRIEDSGGVQAVMAWVGDLPTPGELHQELPNNTPNEDLFKLLDGEEVWLVGGTYKFVETFAKGWEYNWHPM